MVLLLRLMGINVPKNILDAGVRLLYPVGQTNLVIWGVVGIILHIPHHRWRDAGPFFVVLNLILEWLILGQ